MDTDDIPALVLMVLLAVVPWVIWYRRMTEMFAPRSPRALRATLGATPPLLLVVFFVVLGFVADEQVAGSIGYRALYTATTALSVRFLWAISKLFGLDPVEDGIQRANSGIGIAAVGTALAAVVLNIGSNIGTGDTIASTLLPAALGTVEMAIFLLLIAWATDLPETIVSSRSIAAGWRIAALATAASFGVARGASGDWVSAGRSIHDLAVTAYVPLALVAIASVGERLWPAFESRHAEATFRRGVVPAMAYLVIGALLTWAPFLLRP